MDPAGQATADETRRREPVPPLTGRVEATPWDDELPTAMVTADVAVHEEALIDVLLDDLK